MKRLTHIWMQLLGFDRDAADKGVDAFLERTGFVPDSVCLLLYHPDFVHLHRGMNFEYTLFPDNCAYCAAPRNRERERQPWTNYDLRTLIAELKNKGIACYASIFGSYLNNKFHQEWLSDYPELRCCKRDKPGSLMCLKRFADGSYYQDYFKKKLVQTLVDYDLAGIHLADSFCPSFLLYLSDYSTDMMEQFVEQTKIAIDPMILESMGDDSTSAIETRADYIWENLREQWICFYQWRWEEFFRTVCDAVHSVGKKVWVLGMYCTDPFETAYMYGFDTKRVMDAGVDCITANILPTSVSMNKIGFPYYFHRMHMDLPFTRAQIDGYSLVSMINVQDASEEWSVLEHRPVQLERDIYTITSFQQKNETEYIDAVDGIMICLGDGIDPYHWKFLSSRMSVGADVKVSQMWSPMILWSDTAQKRMLSAYIASRRTTAHKQSFEIFKAGTPFGGTLRTERMKGFEGVLFVPNFDLLSDAEKDELIASKIPFLGTAPIKCDLNSLAITCRFSDEFSDEPLQAFVCNGSVKQELQREIQQLCLRNDDFVSTVEAPESKVTALYTELPFCKLTNGFVQALAVALRGLMEEKFPVISSQPMMAVHLTNGMDRLYLYNTQEDHYDRAVVTCPDNLKSVNIVSHYPVLPPRFVQQETSAYTYQYDKPPETTNRFQVKIAPGGMTIVDIERSKL